MTRDDLQYVAGLAECALCTGNCARIRLIAGSSALMARRAHDSELAVAATDLGLGLLKQVTAARREVLA